VAVRGLVVAVVLGGCNWVYGLDSTRVFDASPDANPLVDEDLDGVLNADDNCPGVPNPEQANISGLADGPGDACDPDGDTVDTVLAAYYFNDANDATHFTLDPTYRLATGFVDIDPLATIAYMRGIDMPAFTRGTLTIEAGFELVEANAGTHVGVYTDGETAHYSWVELRPEPYLVIINTPTPPAVCVDGARMGCDEESIPLLPARIVVQQRSGSMKRDGIKSILAATGIDSTFDATEMFENTFGIVAQNARARLLHVIVYSGQ
jgi:hypothetical protein